MTTVLPQFFNASKRPRRHLLSKTNTDQEVTHTYNPQAQQVFYYWLGLF